MTNGERVVDQLLRYLRCVCDDEIVGIEDHLACLCSVVSIVHLLFTSDSAITESLSSSESSHPIYRDKGFEEVITNM